MPQADPEERREYLRRWRAANPEKVRESERRRRATEDPEKRRETLRRWRAANPERQREISAEGYRRQFAADPEKFRERGRRWRATNPEKARESTRQWEVANPESHRERARRYREAHREEINKKARVRRESERAAVFAHYGEQCACCGSTEKLTIDHVNGGGEQHRRELFGTGRAAGSVMYGWLVRQHFPEGFQVLCLSCNASKKESPRCRLDHPRARRIS